MNTLILLNRSNRFCQVHFLVIIKVLPKYIGNLKFTSRGNLIYLIKKAISLDRNEIAVKVQYPIVRKYFEIDMFVQILMMKAAAYFFPGYDFVFMTERLEIVLKSELDFLQEAKNGLKAKQNFKNRKDVYIPEPIKGIVLIKYFRIIKFKGSDYRIYSWGKT
jgi:predicted unusual protein kinase regulating ubiquinone biosynthesis (AarF/ABC1/UbiB family)